jgi:hypothetical protein
MKYKATITFTIDIDATNLRTAEYLAKQAVPKHSNSSSTGLDGSGHCSFKEVISVGIEKVKK